MTLRDDLAARARRGDRAALDLLLAAVPRDLSPAILRGWRDTEIRRLAAALRGSLPGASGRQVAAVLAAAGHRIEAGFHSLAGCLECRALTTAEAQDLAACISRILDLAPAKWPARRQIERIIFECVTNAA